MLSRVCVETLARCSCSSREIVLSTPPRPARNTQRPCRLLHPRCTASSAGSQTTNQIYNEDGSRRRKPQAREDPFVLSRRGVCSPLRSSATLGASYKSIQGSSHFDRSVYPLRAVPHCRLYSGLTGRKDLRCKTTRSRADVSNISIHYTQYSQRCSNIKIHVHMYA